MKIFKFILISLICSFQLSIAEVVDLNWNRPEITTNCRMSFLENEKTNTELIKIPQKPAKDFQKSFALSSFSVFRKSLKNFFSFSDENSKFFYYQTPDFFQKPTKSFSLYSEKIPLKSRIDFSIISGFDFVSSKNKNYTFLYYGGHLSGYLMKRLYFYGNWWAGHFAGNTELAKTSPIMDGWTQTTENGEIIYLDNVSGKLSYRGKGDFWSVSVGRGKYEIGNNIGGSIILNDDCNDYGYLSNKFDFKNFSVSFLHANLIPDSTSEFSDKKYGDKYLVVHKISWKPNRVWELFFGEEVVYANRSIDMSYLLPQVFFRAVEHNLRDRDNVLIFSGANWRIFPNDLFYLNFIFDELSKSKIFTDWWGNKYAVQLGNSLKIRQNSKFTLEFTAIRPWIYTHYIMENKFSHDGIGLGFPAGSNLLQFASELNLQIRKNLSFDIHGSYTKQGSVGNNFLINYNSRPSDSAKWLEGDISNVYRAKAIITWKPLAHHKIKFGTEIKKTDEIVSLFGLSYQAEY